MADWFTRIGPVYQALAASSFAYGITVLGAALVFFFKNVNQHLMDVMMGFAAGVMIAASCWSLLEPSLTLSGQLGRNAAANAAAGLLLGALFIIATDLLMSGKESIQNRGESWTRCMLLVTAVAMHNIPEGLAMGVAFGCAALEGGETSLIGAVMLAVGVGIQNFPEGTCVAMPLRREGMSRWKSFMISQFCALVEPAAAVLGALFALKVQSILPMVLSFSAGAMISVVCSELIPESFRDNKQLATLGVMAGFVTMMVLDVTFSF